MKIENFIKDDSILKKEINFKISKKKLFLFLRQFSILLNAKIPIIEIVKLLKEQKEFKQLKPSLNKVYDNLNGGMSVTESFSNDKNFDAFFTSMLKLGEESGKLDKVVYDLSKYYERTYDINKKNTKRNDLSHNTVNNGNRDADIYAQKRNTNIHRLIRKLGYDTPVIYENLD